MDIQRLSAQNMTCYSFTVLDTRFLKAQIFNDLEQKSQALAELNYIIEKFPNEDEYLSARQLKDEIENPPKKGMCFVATAAYGSPLAPEVILLSCFRDDVLLQTKLGKLFVAFYYRVSPPLASLIEKTSFLRAATRTLFLAPILRLVKFLKSSE
jgi:hypothetical protein